MKYIRTKDGIFKVIKNDYPHYTHVEMKYASGVMMHESVIEKSADDIEELCDCFVDYCEEEDSHLVYTGKPIRRYGYEVYGAIWTDEGLKYVAKMNEKREFELL